MSRIFSHKNNASCKPAFGTQMSKSTPTFESPLKDSYSNSLKDLRRLSWSSPSGIVKSPLKISTPSPKPSERLTSPLSVSSAINNATSPIKGVGIGSTWSATLDDLINKCPDSSVKYSKSNDAGKENFRGSPLSKSDIASAKAPNKPSKPIFDRQILSPEMSLQYCNLSPDLEGYIENFRRWFTRQILSPLSKQINQVDSALEAAGLSHLISKYPANYSMAAKSLDSDLISPHFYLSAPSGYNEPKIQSLMDLERARPNDPTVKARLKIEKYLSLAVISSHRTSFIRRISALADGSFLGSYHPFTALQTSSGPSEPSRIDPFDDTQILLHLFTTFMDDNLPSENANDSRPFSSNFFVSLEEKVSTRADSIQLQQISINPIVLRIIAEDKILQAHPGQNNLFESILLFVDYIHRNRKGYLGIGNLDSINIDLISILRK